MVTPPTSQTTSDTKPMLESWRAFLVLLIVMVVGLLAIIAYAYQGPNVSDILGRASVGVLTAGASMVVGGLLGFLFGIPRTYPGDQPPQAQNETRRNESVTEYRANTNLEQISDWLTKILVGVGLTQLANLPEGLLALAAHVAQGLGDAPSAPTMASVVLVHFHICGFLLAYLWTRLYLPGEFRQADTLNTLARKVAKLEGQAELDAIALNHTQRQINPSSDNPPVPGDDLAKAIKAASPAARALIFTQAQQVRKDNWQSNKPIMKRVIPVFQALIESDPGGEYHRWRGQLGYSLKDQPDPNWADAEEALTKAIQLRGSWKKGWVLYEFNRAFCRILRTKAEQLTPATHGDLLQSIVDDLRIAIKGGMEDVVFRDPEIKKWMVAQKMTEQDLR